MYLSAAGNAETGPCPLLCRAWAK